MEEPLLNVSVYFTPPETNSTSILMQDSSTQTQEGTAEYEIPKTEVLVEDFNKWLTTIDGGCYNEYTSKLASLIVKNILNKLSLLQIMDSTTMCDYFTKDQTMSGVSAASLSVYLRYFSSFLFYFHDQNRNYFPYEK